MSPDLVNSPRHAALNPACARYDLKVTKQHLRELLARVQGLYEEDRIRMANMVHDDISQRLTALSIELALLQKELKDSVSHAAKVGEILALTGQISKAVRKFTNDLRPKILDEFGLVPTMKYECQRLEKSSGLIISFSSDEEDVRLPKAIAAELFRVFQEIANNTLRHAHASEMDVKVITRGEGLKIIIRDNGKGIAREKINSLRSLGLLNIQERVLRLGGKVQFKKARIKGTTVTLQIPAEVWNS